MYKLCNLLDSIDLINPRSWKMMWTPSWILVTREGAFWNQFEECACSTKESQRVTKSQTLRIQSPSQMMIGVYNHLLRKVFRFHYHSQKVIGSLEHHFGHVLNNFFPPHRGFRVESHIWEVLIQNSHHPDPWGKNDPIWLGTYFSDGLVSSTTTLGIYILCIE